MKHSAEDVGQPLDHVALTPEPPSWTIDRADMDNQQLTRYLQIFCKRKYLRPWPETEGRYSWSEIASTCAYATTLRWLVREALSSSLYETLYNTLFPFFVRSALILLSRTQQCYRSMWELGSLRHTNSHVARSTELQTEQWEQIWQTRICS